MLFEEYISGERRKECLHEHIHVSGRENEKIIWDETCKHLKRKEALQDFLVHSHKEPTS